MLNEISKSACNCWDLSITNYVWGINKINTCFYLFGNATQSSYYKGKGFCFSFMFCPNCSSSIYTFVNLFIFLNYDIILRYRYINRLLSLSPFIITTISGLSCFIFVVVLISLSLGYILIPVWFIVCNGICSWQSVSSDFYVILSAQLPVWLKVTSFNISSSDISQVFQITLQSISPT